MAKKLIKFIIYILLILSILVFYLSYFGINTKSFNQKIQDKIFENTYNCSNRFNPSTNGSAPTMALSKLWGSGTSSAKFPHPKGTFSAVGGTVPNYFNRYARGSCGGSTGDQFEFSTRMENTTTEIEVWTCINKETSDRLVTKIPIE